MSLVMISLLWRIIVGSVLEFYVMFACGFPGVEGPFVVAGVVNGMFCSFFYGLGVGLVFACVWRYIRGLLFVFGVGFVPVCSGDVFGPSVSAVGRLVSYYWDLGHDCTRSFML